MMSQACRKFSTLKVPSSMLKNFIKLIEERLQDVSSRKTNSEHGLDALIRPVVLTGFHLFVVVAYCIPGSPQTQAASAAVAMRSRARYFLCGSPARTSVVHRATPLSTATMN